MIAGASDQQGLGHDRPFESVVCRTLNLFAWEAFRFWSASTNLAVTVASPEKNYGRNLTQIAHCGLRRLAPGPSARLALPERGGFWPGSGILLSDPSERDSNQCPGLWSWPGSNGISMVEPNPNEPPQWGHRNLAPDPEVKPHRLRNPAARGRDLADPARRPRLSAI